MCLIGASMYLFVVGRIEPLGDGVLKGLIEADSDWDNPALDAWLGLCERSYGYWRAVGAAEARKALAQ